jgi:hypothetical protein
MSKNELPDFIETYTGRHFHFHDPKPEDIHINDIARALATTTRWGGHTQVPVTVAQHSVLAARRLRNMGFGVEQQLQGLLHDAAEAYIGDVPSPIKRHLHDFQALELLVEQAICECFDLAYPFDPAVKIVDVQMYRWEYRDLMLGDQCEEPQGNPPTFVPWPFHLAEGEFLAAFDALMGARE